LNVTIIIIPIFSAILVKSIPFERIHFQRIIFQLKLNTYAHIYDIVNNKVEIKTQDTYVQSDPIIMKILFVPQ